MYFSGSHVIMFTRFVLEQNSYMESGIQVVIRRYQSRIDPATEPLSAIRHNVIEKVL
jgi:hypothetical protein